MEGMSTGRDIEHVQMYGIPDNDDILHFNYVCVAVNSVSLHLQAKYICNANCVMIKQLRLGLPLIFVCFCYIVQVEQDSSSSVSVKRKIKPRGEAQAQLTPYHPPKEFQFPERIYGQGANQRKRSAQHSWFTMFPWLTYSPANDVVHCIYCYNAKVKSRYNNELVTTKTSLRVCD